eukprot:TRINITY_DN103894_c0_g1_i1.p1 TRINITY_DN103894_c0_g1~~TRINITY_DN103894_c0_g1_i1.p1  ORF type:complete len:698 (+),score=277.02 TRINITY_DN103894_c0_g1_i1:76-2094(+)
MSGGIPFITQAQVVDVRGTAITECPPVAVLESQTLQALDVKDLAFDSPTACYDTAHHMLQKQWGSAIANASRGGLECPQWRTVASNAFVDASSSFMGFVGCDCPPGTYFGLPIESVHVPGDIGDLTDINAVFDPRSCVVCNHDAMWCDTPAVQPKHRLRTGRFALLPVAERVRRATRCDQEYVSSDPNPPQSCLVYATTLKCHNPGVCAPNDSSNGSRCAIGHDPRSLLCSKCAADYYDLGDGECHACLRGYDVLVPLSVVLIVVFYVAYLWTRDMQREMGMKLSIVLGWLQLMQVLNRSMQVIHTSSKTVSTSSVSSSAQSSTGRDGTLVDQAQKLLQTIAMFRPWAFECLSSSFDYVTDSYLILVVAPLMTIAIWCAANWHERRRADDSPNNDSPNNNSPNNASNLTTHARIRFIACFTMDLLFMPVSHRIYSAFNCYSYVRSDTQQRLAYLSAAPWLSCSTGKYTGLLVTAVLSLVLLVVPMSMWSYRNAHDTVEWSFLTSPVRRRFWWWLPVVARLRKTMIAVTVAVLPFDSIAIPLLVFVIVLAFLMAHVTYQPYRSSLANHLETTLAAMTLLIYLTALVGGNGSTSTYSSSAHAVRQALYFVTLVGVVVTMVVSEQRLRCRGRRGRHLSLSSSRSSVSAASSSVGSNGDTMVIAADDKTVPLLPIH